MFKLVHADKKKGVTLEACPMLCTLQACLHHCPLRHCTPHHSTLPRASPLRTISRRASGAVAYAGHRGYVTCCPHAVPVLSLRCPGAGLQPMDWCAARSASFFPRSGPLPGPPLPLNPPNPSAPNLTAPVPTSCLLAPVPASASPLLLLLWG